MCLLHTPHKLTLMQRNWNEMVFSLSRAKFILHFLRMQMKLRLMDLMCSTTVHLRKLRTNPSSARGDIYYTSHNATECVIWKKYVIWKWNGIKTVRNAKMNVTNTLFQLCCMPFHSSTHICIVLFLSNQKRETCNYYSVFFTPFFYYHLNFITFFYISVQFGAMIHGVKR